MSDAETFISQRLRAAVDDVHPPASYSATVLRGGRVRRWRRHAAAGLAAVVIGSGGAALLGAGHLTGAAGPDVADDGGATSYAAALAWARDLPEGPSAGLPFFGEGGLHDGDQVVPVPDEVNRSSTPRRVVGGWVVVLGSSWPRIEPAVLSPDGSVRPLPEFRFPRDWMDTTVLASPDGTRVAYGDRVVDVTTGESSPLAHNPAQGPDTEPKHVNTLDLVAWGSDGLVYRGTPVAKGWGTTWLRHDDGSTTQILPADDPRSVQGAGVADVVLTFDYSDKRDTCSTPQHLEGGAWVDRPTHCMGRYLGESLDMSPDGRWLLTDDLPEVWDLEQGEWAEVDLPRPIVEDWGESWMPAAGWESPDTFLIPVADRWAGWEPVAEPFDQHLQVVRCRMSTGACERAGDEQVVRVTDEERSNPMQEMPGVAFSGY